MEKENNGQTSLAYPPRIDPVTGRFAVSGGTQSIKDSLRILLLTQKKERFTRPEFGTGVRSWLFLDPSPTRIHMLERQLQDDILSQEPRITEAQVRISLRPEEACMTVDVVYTVKETGERDTQQVSFLNG